MVSRCRVLESANWGPATALASACQPSLPEPTPMWVLISCRFRRSRIWKGMLGELAGLFLRRERITDAEFPRLRPKRAHHVFPEHAISWTGFAERVERVRSELRAGVNSGPTVQYVAPWTSNNVSRGIARPRAVAERSAACRPSRRDVPRHLCLAQARRLLLARRWLPCLIPGTVLERALGVFRSTVATGAGQARVPAQPRAAEYRISASPRRQASRCCTPGRNMGRRGSRFTTSRLVFKPSTPKTAVRGS